MSQIKTTPLNAWHKEHKAKMVDFAGWEMPVQYSGIIHEHHHTREQASLFDICHMGEFTLKGQGAKKALGKIVSHNLDTLAVGKCRYGFMLNEKGGVLDDLIVYCKAEDEYMLVVNGACEESDFEWCKKHLSKDVKLENISAQTAKIDLQGPKALEALEQALGASYRHIKYFNHETVEFQGDPMIVSRTGYTGELGYEFYLPTDKVIVLWEALVAVDFVEPAGLGARDTLRLELGYPLYGHDLDIDHTPMEAGYGFLLGGDNQFIGKEALDTVRQNLIALKIEGRRSARHHDKILTAGGREVGYVTSGSFAPSLGYCIALAYVDAAEAERTRLKVKGARVELDAERTELPFYTKGTARTKLS